MTLARHESTCHTCHELIQIGQPIVIHRDTWHHRACWERGHE